MGDQAWFELQNKGGDVQAAISSLIDNPFEVVKTKVQKGRWEGRWEDRWEDKWEGKWEGKWEDKWALGPPLGLLTSTCSMPPSSSRWECRATTEESKGRCQHDGPRRVTLLFFLV